jgi:catechol 2,3-dioxygenase-like lactoylglutathione lyase family enzyme
VRFGLVLIYTAEAMKILSTRLALGLLCTGTLLAQAESSVIGVGPFFQVVSDLDQSLTFYRGTLGLDFANPKADRNFIDKPEVAKLYGVPGKRVRGAVLKIPGSTLGIELVQWEGARKPQGKSSAGPGAATLILRVASGSKVPKGTLHDPDGYAIQVEQAETPGAELNISVSDIKKTAALYTKAFAFKADGNWLAVPGAAVRIHLTKSDSKDGLKAGFPDPGRGMLRLSVRNIGALTDSWKNGGFSVITTGNEPVSFPTGQRAVIVRDPNNFYVQAVEGE